MDEIKRDRIYKKAMEDTSWYLRLYLVRSRNTKKGASGLPSPSIILRAVATQRLLCSCGLRWSLPARRGSWWQTR